MVGVIALSGCGGTTGAAEPGTGPAGSSASASQPSGRQPAQPKIGDAYRYDDGVVVEIVKSRRGKASQYAAGAKPGASLAIITLRIRSGSAENMSTAGATVQVSYGPDGESAERVFDGNKASGHSGTIVKGAAKTADYAFAVPAKFLSDVSVEVNPNVLDYDAVVFTGSIG